MAIFANMNYINMKIEKSIVGSFVLLVVVASVYRIMPGRPMGFAPQIAMALFAGSIVKDKKYSFILPLLSMLVSDFLYEMLFQAKLTSLQGFYKGQWINYLLIASVTMIGFWVSQKNLFKIIAGSLAGATFYFIASNFTVWIGGGLGLNNLPYPKTLEGLMTTYIAGLPFYKMSIISTLFFSGLLFGGYNFINKFAAKKSALNSIES